MKQNVIPLTGGDTLAREVAALRREVAELRAIIQPDRPDMLHGLDQIGAHLGLTARQAKHMHDTGNLPTFKIGRAVCARRAALDAWLAAQSEGRA